MAKFRVETQLAIDKASAQGAKVAMEGITKAATQMAGAIVGEKVFVAPFKAMKSVIEDAIGASEKATAAQDRMKEAIKGVYATIGDEMTPGLNQLDESIHQALANPEVMKGLQTTGQLLSLMASGVSAVVDEIAGFVGSPQFSAWLQFVSGVDLDSDAMKRYREQGKAVDEITAAVSKWAKGVAEQQKAEEKAAEARKKAHQEHLKDLQSILDKVSPIAKAERETWQQILTLNQAMKAGEIDVNTYQQALAFLTRELNNVKEAAGLAQQEIATLDIAPRDINTDLPSNPFAGGSMTISQSPYVQEMMRAEEDFTTNLAAGMGDAVASFAREFIETGKINVKHLGDMLLDVLLNAAQQYFATMVANQAKLKMEGAVSGGGGGSSVASAAGIVAIAYVAMKAFADSQNAKIDHEFQDLKVYFGSLSGGQGSAGYRFTDSALEAGNTHDQTALVQAIASFMETFRDAIGGTITGIGEVALKVRKDGKEFEAIFKGEVLGHFATVEEALIAGIQAAFKAGDFTGTIDPIIQQVVANFAGDKTKIFEAINQVRSIIDATSGLSDIQLSIRDMPAKTDAVARSLEAVGVSAEDAAILAAKWNAVQMQNVRDQITGHQATEAEQLAQKQREAQMFDAQLALDKAKTDAEILNLQNQIAIENAKVDAMNASNQAQLAILNASLAAYQQIAAIYATIAPIDLAEIRIPGAGRHGGGGHAAAPSGPTEEELAQQHADAVAQFWQGIADAWRSILPGLSQRIAELDHWYEEQAARATELGIPLAELNDLYDQQLLNLQNDTLASLGLQSVATAQQFADLRDALKYLTDWGAISADQIRELGDSFYISLVDSLLQYVDDEGVRRQLEDLRFRMEMANYQLQFQMLQGLGLLTEAEIAVINGLFASIQEAYDAGALQFQLPTINQTQSNSGGYDDARAAAEQALRQALDRLRSAVDGLREFQEGLLLSDATPLTVSQQYQEAARQYAALLAAAQGGDINAMEGLAAAAQTYLNLAAQMFGTSGAGYGEIFAQVSEQVAAIVAAGQAVLDAAPMQMQGVEDRLDTLAEILRAIGGFGAGGIGGTGGADPYAGLVNYGSYGWHPLGWTPSGGFGHNPTTHLAAASLGSAGNLSLGNFNSPGQAVTVRAPELEAKVLALTEAHAKATNEAKADRMKKTAAGLAGFYGSPIGSQRSA